LVETDLSAEIGYKVFKEIMKRLIRALYRGENISIEEVIMTSGHLREIIDIALQVMTLRQFHSLKANETEQITTPT